MKQHVIVTGPCEAGCRSLGATLASLGFDAGAAELSDPSGWWRAPHVVVDPHIRPLLRGLVGNGFPVAHVVVPVSPPASGLVGRVDREPCSLDGLAYDLADLGLACTLLAHPRLAEDAAYLKGMLPWLLGRVPEERVAAALAAGEGDPLTN